MTIADIVIIAVIAVAVIVSARRFVKQGHGDCGCGCGCGSHCQSRKNRVKHDKPCCTPQQAHQAPESK